MQNPTDQAEASIPTVTGRESPNLSQHQYRAVKVRRKAAKRSERWYQDVATPLPPPPQAEVVIPAKKKPRLEEPLRTTADEAATKNRTHASTRVARSPPTDHAATDHATATADSGHPVMSMHPNSRTASWASRQWTPEEDAKLTSAVAKTKKKLRGKKYMVDFVAVAALVPGRERDQCRKRWNDVLNPRYGLTAGSAGVWTADEDLKLRDAVPMHSGKNWAAIAALVPSRTKSQCRNRWHDVLDPSIALLAGRKVRWTADEDIKLKNLVQIHGGKDWNAIAALVQGRTKMQCRKRWNGALNPSIALTAGRAGKWTEDEDLKLKNSVQMHGDKDWVAVAALVPGRTKKQCLNRWRY